MKNYILIVKFLFFILFSSTSELSSQNLDSLIKVLSKNNLQRTELNSLIVKLLQPTIVGTEQADSLIEKAKSICINGGYNFETALIYRYYGKKHLIQGEYQKSIDSLKKSLNYLNVKKDSTDIAITFQFISSACINSNKYDSALFYCDRAKNIFNIKKDLKNLASAYNTLGGIYYSQGNIPKSIEAFTKSLDIKKELGDSIAIANSLNNIAMIYDSQEKNEAALELYHRALDIYQKKDNKRGIEWTSNNIAVIYKKTGKYSEAIEMFSRSLEINKNSNNNNPNEQGKTLNNIGLLYLELKDYQKSIGFFNQALEALTQSGNENGIAAAYINLGRVHLVQKNYAKSETYYTKSLELATRNDSKEWIRDSYEGLYQTTKALGKHKTALQFHEKFKLLNDSLRSLENLNKLDQLKVEFETDQKEKEIALLSKDNELNTLKLKKHESVTHLLLTIIISSLIIIFLILLYVHRLKADKTLLIQKNTEITQQKEKILAQRDMLEASNIELNQQKEELLSQSEQIEIQHQLISGINRRMTEGLEYASLIQQTLLPSSGVFSKHFSDQFILFKPKDIVSGDLYWTWEENDEIIFAVADCTGHGVAGAFMSVMAISLLKDAVSVNKLNRPEQIANYLYNEFIKSSNLELNSIVGIDFIISKYSAKEKKLSYCGNHMNFIWLKDGEIELYKVGRMFNANSSQYKFQENSINLKEDVKLYFYTDGYTDQLSGIKRKKMGRNELQKLIVSIERQPMYLQSETIDTFYNKWKGNFEQVDDVLVIGLKV